MLANPAAKAVAAAPTYSRVELWLQKQSSAKTRISIKTKPLMLTSAAVHTVVPAPKHDLAHAIVLAAAMDSAEHNSSQPVASLQSRAHPMHRRVRMPSCYDLPCKMNSLLPQGVAELTQRETARAKTKTLRIAARPDKPVKKTLLRTAKTDGTKILGKAPVKLQKVAARSNVDVQARAKTEKKLALRRYRETPAEISYRSFVGLFVPAT